MGITETEPVIWEMIGCATLYGMVSLADGFPKIYGRRSPYTPMLPYQSAFVGAW